MPSSFTLATALLVALTSSSLTHAAIYTVGPGGTHATLQDAAIAAGDTAAADEIRLCAVELLGTAQFAVTSSTGSLAISGGWNADYSAVVATGSAFDGTALNASGMGTGLKVIVVAGTLELRGFRVVYGTSSTTSDGGNIDAMVTGSGELAMTDMHFRNGSSPSAGAGGQFQASASGIVRCHACSFENNTLSATGGGYFGAGARLTTSGSALIDFTDVAIFGNTGAPSSTASGGFGLSVVASGSSLVELADLTVNANAMAGAGSAVDLTARNDALINAERLTVRLNSSTHSASRQLGVDVSDSGTVYVTDSLISDSGLIGVGAFAPTGTIRFNNLTVAGNGRAGIDFSSFPGSTLSLYNSIVHGNGPTAGSGIAGSNNLGANLGLPAPGFVSASDYHLAAGAAAVDAGTGSVPGGLGAFDLDRQARVSGSGVDIGAYEVQADSLFAHGFE